MGGEVEGVLLAQQGSVLVVRVLRAVVGAVVIVAQNLQPATDTQEVFIRRVINHHPHLIQSLRE